MGDCLTGKINLMLFNIITAWYDRKFGWGLMLLEVESSKWDHTRGFLGISWITDGRAVGIDFLYFYREFKLIKNEPNSN